MRASSRWAMRRSSAWAAMRPVSTPCMSAANEPGFVTGGNDGLQGVAINPILGAFDFDMFGRTAYLYCLAVLFVAWLFARRLVHSPFGQSLIGIRENVTRMHA